MPVAIEDVPRQIVSPYFASVSFFGAIVDKDGVRLYLVA